MSCCAYYQAACPSKDNWNSTIFDYSTFSALSPWILWFMAQIDRNCLICDLALGWLEYCRYVYGMISSSNCTPKLPVEGACPPTANCARRVTMAVAAMLLLGGLAMGVLLP